MKGALLLCGGDAESLDLARSLAVEYSRQMPYLCPERNRASVVVLSLFLLLSTSQKAVLQRQRKGRGREEERRLRLSLLDCLHFARLSYFFPLSAYVCRRNEKERKMVT